MSTDRLPNALRIAATKPLASAPAAPPLIEAMAARAELSVDDLRKLPLRLLHVSCRIRGGDTLHRDDDLVDLAAHALKAAILAAEAQPATASPHIHAMADAVLRQLDDAYPRETVDLDAVGLLCKVLSGGFTSGAAAEAQPAAQAGWISVEDRMPEPDTGEVLVWLTSGCCHCDEWHTHREDPTGMSTTHTLDMGCMWRTFDFEDITHWMPLPAQPREVAHGIGSKA